MTLPSSPWVLKGALVTLEDTPFVVPIPGFIPFQYNPETLTRTISPYRPRDEEGERTGLTDRSQPAPPEETFTLSLELDATDFLEDPASHPVGSIFGVAPKIASIEKLMYPTGSIIDALIGAITSLLPGHSSPVPRADVPVVLFFWGPSRLLPVRVVSLQIEEQAHSPVLYPIRAKAQISLKVLHPEAFRRRDRTLTPAEMIAVAAYEYTALNRDLLSIAGIVDAVAGILPA